MDKIVSHIKVYHSFNLLILRKHNTLIQYVLETALEISEYFCHFVSFHVLARILCLGASPAPSRSLGTNAFLFSSRNWLGISPVPPSVKWHACQSKQYGQWHTIIDQYTWVRTGKKNHSNHTCHQFGSSRLTICRISPLLKVSPASLHGIRLSLAGL